MLGMRAFLERQGFSLGTPDGRRKTKAYLQIEQCLREMAQKGLLKRGGVHRLARMGRGRRHSAKTKLVPGPERFTFYYSWRDTRETFRDQTPTF